MRILCVGNRYPPWSLGGYEVMWAGAVGALRAHGHDVRILTTLPDPSDRLGEVAMAADVHRELRWYWREHAFPDVGLIAAGRLERANASVLCRHLLEFDPDIVMWWAMGGMSLSLIEQVKRSGTPGVGVVGDDWMAYGPAVDAWTRFWRRGFWRVGARVAERIAGIPTRIGLDGSARWVFISERTRARAAQAGWRLRDTCVSHPGVDLGRFTFQAAGAWGWRLLYCGRIDERKGIATAVEALVHLPAEAVLTIDGDGDPQHRADLHALAARLGVEARVRFQCSEREAVPGAYVAADALVFPVTWSEPWGLVPLEAMAVGRPVVASGEGGTAEYLEPGANCLRFAPGDARALADAVAQLAGDPGLRSRLCAAGSITAARFADTAFFEALERELVAVLERPEGRAPVSPPFSPRANPR